MKTRILSNIIFLAIVLKFVKSKALYGNGNEDDSKYRSKDLDLFVQPSEAQTKENSFERTLWNSRDLNSSSKSNETESKSNKKEIKSRSINKSEENRNISDFDRTRGINLNSYYRPTLREKLFGPRIPHWSRWNRPNFEIDNPIHDAFSFIFNLIREAWENVCFLWDSPPHYIHRSHWR